MIYNDENIDYIAVVYKQRNNQLLDVFISEESYNGFINAIKDDTEFEIMYTYGGNFIK